MAKSKSQKSSSVQRATSSQQSSSAVGSSTQQSSSAQKSTAQKTSAAQRREAQRQQQMASAERNRAKTRNTHNTHSGSRGRKQASPAVSPVVWVAVALLVVAAAVGIFFYLSNQSQSSGSSSIAINGRKAAPQQVVNEVTNVSPSVLQSVDIGQVQTTPIPLSGQPSLTGPSGKPEFFYYGAEYCPYCAAQRWSMIVALSRFGTFKNLSITTSSASDVYASTPTFSFYGSSYTSSYIDFVSVETTTNQPDSSGGYVTLETPTAQEQQLVNQYDASPYTSQPGSIPFVDIANKYIMIGPAYSPQLLQGQNWQQIASALSDPSSQMAQGIIGGANYLTAAICESTNQQPASVCQAAPIPAIEAQLNKASFNAGGPQLAAIGSAPVAYVRRQD
ncbi:MAG TPA: DUF929 family protein [Ktedonobacteraceae bacterium]|nr:DUF929 family protein [Ktedonobacteraceae bacterium]